MLQPAGICCRVLYCFLMMVWAGRLQAQTNSKAGRGPAAMVNVFLGTSGDHGQLSPAASYPFSMLSIGPQTYPHLHAGYEYAARQFLGFTHNRFEGVGCQGSGGNILVKPFTGADPASPLIKEKQSGEPGYYEVSFTNKIQAAFTVYQRTGAHRYHFPEGQNGFLVDLSHTLANRFVGEAHTIAGNSLSGWVEAKTTCNVGTYRIYYYLSFNKTVQWEDSSAHMLLARLAKQDRTAEIRVGMSSVSVAYAKAALEEGSFDALRALSFRDWNNTLGRIRIEGDHDREQLFYSLLYRTLQSPYVISEKDGTYRATNGLVQQAADTMYNGWAIWDNYRTQLPLLSVAWPEKYKGMVTSLAQLYRSGKKDYATQTEPTNTVRTEHAIVVLLDAYRKGYVVQLEHIIDSLVQEAAHLDDTKPDKALESSYDCWALSEILSLLNRKELSETYREKALAYKTYWNKDFKDISGPDVDKVQARGLYQGTIWQYRWFVPFDVKGLIALTGGMPDYLSQLNYFFENDLYNHANEPDLQAPLMYNVTPEAWKSQELMHRFAVDTVVQYYFNDNSRGIDPFVDVVYKNEPKAYIRTMDDDAGAMSAWYILTACGFSPACPGWPIYYLNVPLLKTVAITWPGKKAFEISVANEGPANKYIQKVMLNGKELRRNYITHEEMMAGGQLVITASDKPRTDQQGLELWISQF